MTWTQRQTWLNRIGFPHSNSWEMNINYWRCSWRTVVCKWLGTDLGLTIGCFCWMANEVSPPSLQVRKHVNDLYEDLRDGHNLISLLEVLSGESLVSSVLPQIYSPCVYCMLWHVQPPFPLFIWCLVLSKVLSKTLLVSLASCSVE